MSTQTVTDHGHDNALARNFIVRLALAIEAVGVCMVLAAFYLR